MNCRLCGKQKAVKIYWNKCKKCWQRSLDEIAEENRRLGVDKNPIVLP